MRVRLFTAAHDERAGAGVIGSRLGLQRSAETFGPDTEFNAAWLGSAIACVLIDEAQFLTPLQVRQLHRLAHQQPIPVMCYGLRSDFQGVAFPGAAELLTLADVLEEMKTICACARKASMNLRVDDQGRRIKKGAQVLIGGNNRYRAVCPNCFYSEADDSYIADIPDFEFCSAYGETPFEALQEVEIAKNAWIETAKAEGKLIPKPKYRPVIYQSLVA